MKKAGAGERRDAYHGALGERRQMIPGYYYYYFPSSAAREDRRMDGWMGYIMNDTTRPLRLAYLQRFYLTTYLTQLSYMFLSAHAVMFCVWCCWCKYRQTPQRAAGLTRRAPKLINHIRTPSLRYLPRVVGSNPRSTFRHGSGCGQRTCPASARLGTCLFSCSEMMLPFDDGTPRRWHSSSKMTQSHAERT